MRAEKKKGQMMFFRATKEMREKIRNLIKKQPGLKVSEFIRECMEKVLEGAENAKK